jgi:hypothetical protein
MTIRAKQNGDDQEHPALQVRVEQVVLRVRVEHRELVVRLGLLGSSYFSL